jgi:N-acetylneuraminic acid mutarotase
MKNIYLLVAVLFLSGISSAQAPNSWTQKNNFPGTARATSFAFAIGNKAYVGGGLNFSVGMFSDFREYDPATDTWTPKANFGGGLRSAAVAFTIGGKGYVLTGADNTGKKNDIWEYDPVADTWTQKTPLPSTPRNYAVAFSIGSKGYLATGYTDSTFIALNDFWQFDPVANSWAQKQNVPGPTRSSAIGFGIGGKGYVGTGDTCDINNCFFLNDFYEYDTLSNTWTQKASAGASLRSDAVAFTINGKGYICTGEVNSVGTNDLIEYDPVNDTWTVRASKPGLAKTNACAFSVGNRGYVTTGYDNSFNCTDDVYEYAPDSAVIITSVSENLNSTNISLAPNPASDKVSIIFPDKNLRNVTLMVRNVAGEILLEQRENDLSSGTMTIDMSKLANGIYFFDMNIDKERVRKILLKQ